MSARMDAQPKTAEELWPALPYDDWKDTLDTLHMWTQVVGKVKLELCPFLNHWWGVALSVTPRGLTTSNIPSGRRAFAVDFDFLEHRLDINISDGSRRSIALGPQPVADFYKRFMTTLGELQIPVRINVNPSEVDNGIPFDQDRVHASYEPEYATRFWRILLQIDRLLRKFRTTFIGKSSPPLFWWGSFDISAGRYSGRTAPARTYPARWMALADGNETSSAGFWPGGNRYPAPAFFAYTSPEPAGYREASIEPEGAAYDPALNEFTLSYEAVRASPTPDETILAFFQSTYEVGATLAGWDRQALERPDPFPRRGQ